MPPQEQYIKAIVIGNSGVGKSCISRSMVGEDLKIKSAPTIGVEFHNRQVNMDGNSVKVSIYDTAGQEKFSSLVRSYYLKSRIAFIVYDITNRESFQACDRWLQSLYESVPPSQIIVILLGNKLDSEQYRKVSTMEGEEFAKSRDILFFETCAYSKQNVEQAFFQAVREAYVMQGLQSDSYDSLAINFNSRVVVDNSIIGKKSCGC